jgi:hypothetical protein
MKNTWFRRMAFGAVAAIGLGAAMLPTAPAQANGIVVSVPGITYVGYGGYGGYGGYYGYQHWNHRWYHHAWYRHGWSRYGWYR